MSNLSKNHQTLVVADGVSDRAEYANRINRLKQSVGGDNIKVDIAVATPSGLVPDGAPAPAQSADPVDQFAQALAVARELGYNQLVFSVDPQRAS